MSADSTASSSLPLTRYFDLLPLELIRSIIEHLAPLEYDKSTYTSRQRTLFSTCLVSRLFRNLAQPLLFEIMEIEGEKRLTWLEQVTSQDECRLVAGLRILVVIGEIAVREDFNLGLDLASAAVGLEDLRSSSVHLCIESFSGSNLKKLHLSSLNLRNLSGVVFPELSQLSLMETAIHDNGLYSDQFPALRHFAFCDFADYYYPDEVQSFQALAPQLSSMMLDISPLSYIPADLVKIPTLSLLIECEVGQSDLFLRHSKIIVFLRIRSADGADGDVYLQSCWKEWTTIIRSSNAQLPLQELHLSHSLAQNDYEGQDVQCEVMELIDACRGRKIEVVFEMQPDSWLFESQISNKFMKSSEARRAVIENSGNVKK